MDKQLDDLSVAMTVLELIQAEPNVSEFLRKKAKVAQARLPALGRGYQ